VSVEISEPSDLDHHPDWLALGKRLAPLAQRAKGLVQLGEGV
jgi:hypothetical protein